MSAEGSVVPIGTCVACEVRGFDEKEVEVETVGGYGGSVIVGMCVDTSERRVSSDGVGAGTIRYVSIQTCMYAKVHHIREDNRKRRAVGSGELLDASMSMTCWLAGMSGDRPLATVSKRL